MTTAAQAVQAKAIEIGKLAVRATTSAGSGHPTSALSLAHLTTVLMYRVMRWDPAHPDAPGSDRLVLSEGHAVPIIYAACADLGVNIRPLAGQGSAILAVEDSYVGGIGSELAEAAAATNSAPRVHSLAVRNMPRSRRTPDEVLAYVHLAVSGIVTAAAGLAR